MEPELSFGKWRRSVEDVVDLVARSTVLVTVSLAAPTPPKVECEKWNRSPTVTADSVVFEVETRSLPLQR